MPDISGERAATSEETREKFERLLNEVPEQGHYVLVLYVTGSTPKSVQAISAVRSLCEKYLSGHYDLEVVDIYQAPERLAGDQIIAAPTLLKREPLPALRLVGNLGDSERVLMGLNLKPQPEIKWVEV